MNGPVILHLARQQLADEIVAYRVPAPAPLKISPWLAMSLLQKAIRRGEIELAQHAAATLLLIARDRLWRRCGAAAFEEIGVADLQTVSLVTAALAGKRYRATIGGEWKVASFIVDRMTKVPKCRAADDLLLTSDSHPLYRGARSDLATKTTRELIRIAAHRTAPAHGELPIWSASKRMLGSGTRAAAGVPHIETREAWLNPGFASGVPFFEGTSPLHRSRARRTSTT